MTDAAGTYWQETPGIYKQATVHNPPAFQNANNARHPIWHLGRMLTLLVFTSLNHKWRASTADVIDDGRHERGEPLVVQIRGVWQPNTQKRGRGVVEEPSGGRSETAYIIHMDSHDPINILVAAANPSVFPNGVRLVDFDDYGTDGLVNFPMAVQHRGNRYKVKQPLAFWEAGDEELATDPAMYRAECQLWRDSHHERDARGDAPVWGPRV